MMQKIINVHIGEIKIAKRGEMLKAILGSCIGIGVIWKEKSICCLAHCLLPKCPTVTFSIGARYVDQAIRSLVALMKIKNDDFGSIHTIIVGGGNMTGFESRKGIDHVGSHNYEIAIKIMKDMGFKIVYMENGKEEGRKIYIDSSNFSYHVEKIPRIQEA